MQVEYYQPKGVDLQTPHRQDEIYIIAAGSGTFTKAGNSYTFKAGDLIFVPAGIEHRFRNFTDNFATWVIFYGADGGEAEKTE